MNHSRITYRFTFRVFIVPLLALGLILGGLGGQGATVVYIK